MKTESYRVVGLEEKAGDGENEDATIVAIVEWRGQRVEIPMRVPRGMELTERQFHKLVQIDLECLADFQSPYQVVERLIAAGDIHEFKVLDKYARKL